MALDRARIGETYPSYRYEVSREKLREYARALGEPVGEGPGAHVPPAAPPTFAAAFTLARGVETVLADDSLGTHPGLVHASQRFSFGGRPVQPGDVLTCTPRIIDISVRGRNELLDVEVDCRFADGSSAVVSRSVIVFLGSAPQREASA